MNKTLKRSLDMDVFVYSYKCKNSLHKVKSLIAVREIYYEIKYKLAKKALLKKNNLANVAPKAELENRSVNESRFKDSTRSFLLEHGISSFHMNVDVNEIFNPKPYYDQILYSNEILRTKSLNPLKIVKPHSIFLHGKKNSKGRKIRIFAVSMSEYSYKFRNAKNSRSIMITSLQFLDRKQLEAETKSKKRRSLIKLIFFVIILISSYVFLFILVTEIYNKYEDNIIKICIYPLITVVISRFLITQNVMIFVHSFFMYKFGEKFYNDNRKTLNPLGIVFKFVIPGVSKANHKALLTFRSFCNRIR
jgi:hypothetical protein